MGSRRTDRWVPDEAYSLSKEARGLSKMHYEPPLPVYAWIQTANRLVRIEAVAHEASEDAVLVEWGEAGAKRDAWVWRAAVKHRSIDADG